MVSYNHLTFRPCSLALTLSRARGKREEGYVVGPYGIRVAFELDSNIPSFYATYCPGFGEVSQLSYQIDQYPAVLSFCGHGLVQHSPDQLASNTLAVEAQQVIRGLKLRFSSRHFQSIPPGACCWGIRLDSPQRASFQANSTAPMPHPRCSSRWKVAGVVTVRPASTGRTTPVTQRASSLAR